MLSTQAICRRSPVAWLRLRIWGAAGQRKAAGRALPAAGDASVGGCLGEELRRPPNARRDPAFEGLQLCRTPCLARPGVVRHPSAVVRPLPSTSSARLSGLCGGGSSFGRKHSSRGRNANQGSGCVAGGRGEAAINPKLRIGAGTQPGKDSTAKAGFS